MATTMRCECSDSGCPAHKGAATCKVEAPAMAVLYRVDMEDQTGTVMCDACTDDAMESGLFTTADDDDPDADDPSIYDDVERCGNCGQPAKTDQNNIGKCCDETMYGPKVVR